MSTVVIQVRPLGNGFHAEATAHIFATSAEMAARQAAARVLACELHQVSLSEPTERGIYVASVRTVRNVCALCETEITGSYMPQGDGQKICTACHAAIEGGRP